MQKYWLGAISVLILAACGTTSTPQSNVATQAALNAQGKWQTVGKIHNGNLEISYDTGSLQSQADVVKLRSRTLVRDMGNENFLSTPEYKIAVSEWEFVCTRKMHRVLNTHFFNQRQQLVARHDYNIQHAPAQPVQVNTPSYALYEIVCRK